MTQFDHCIEAHQDPLHGLTPKTRWDAFKHNHIPTFARWLRLVIHYTVVGKKRWTVDDERECC